MAERRAGVFEVTNKYQRINPKEITTPNNSKSKSTLSHWSFDDWFFLVIFGLGFGIFSPEYANNLDLTRSCLCDNL